MYQRGRQTSCLMSRDTNLPRMKAAGTQQVSARLQACILVIVRADLTHAKCRVHATVGVVLLLRLLGNQQVTTVTNTSPMLQSL